MTDQNKIDRSDIFVGGKFLDADSKARVEAVNPATEQVVGSVPDSSETDIDRAVAAAQEAFRSWRHTTGQERAQILAAVADGIAVRAEEIKALLTRQNGAPRWWVEQDVGLAEMVYRQAAGEAAELEEERIVEAMGHRTLLRNEPIGVVGAIAPWNSPQVLLAFKVANALAAGCTVVAKPSPETSLDTYLLAEAMIEAGIPNGVMNIVTGGRTAGAAVVKHPGVNKISFTGSTASGISVATECAKALKPLTAELGGKSAAVLLDDANIEDFVASIQRECLPFSGQACFSTTRVMVPRPMHDDVVEAAAQQLESFKFGDPADPETIMGPIVSDRQRERVEMYLKSGIDQGAGLVMGGGRADRFDTGYYIAPTIFRDVDANMRIFAEEIFGPVMTFTAYDTEEEAIALHDATEYGLSGSVFSRDLERATEFARHLDTGQLLLNAQRGVPYVVRDMYNKSAVGGGVDRIAGFQQTKGISQP